MEGGGEVGGVTSVSMLESETFALGYLQSRVDGEAQAWEGRQVQVGDTVAKVRSAAGDPPLPAPRLVCALMACAACLDQAARARNLAQVSGRCTA